MSNHILNMEPGKAMAPIVGKNPRYRPVVNYGRSEALRLIYRRISESERMFGTEPLTPKQTALVVRVALECYDKGEGNL